MTKIGKIDFFSMHARASPMVPFESARQTESVAVEFGKIHNVDQELWAIKVSLRGPSRGPSRDSRAKIFQVWRPTPIGLKIAVDTI